MASRRAVDWISEVAVPCRSALSRLSSSFKSACDFRDVDAADVIAIGVGRALHLSARRPCPAR